MTLSDLPFSLDEIEAEEARRSFRAFISYTFPGYKWSWHSELMATKLDAVAKGLIPRLIITAPPRYGKSEQVSRRLPAFFHGKYPYKNIIGASYGADLSESVNRDVQSIIDSERYTKVFPDTKLNSRNVVTVRSWLRNSETYQVVEHGGKYHSAGVGGALTGKGGHLALLDDPFKNSAEADSPTMREKTWRWFNNVFMTRLMNFDDGTDWTAVVIIMTRWHEDDIVGRIQEKMNTNPLFPRWEIIEFPAISDGNGNEYDKREKDEALWREKHSYSSLMELKASMGSRDFSALYQQRPSASEGTIIKKKWIKYYDDLPVRFERIVLSWDAAFKDRKDSDYVAGIVIGINGPNKYVLDLFREKIDFSGTLKAIERQTNDYPNYSEILIEDAANGPAIISVMKNHLPRLIPITPRGSKKARLEACSPEFESGNVLFPVGEDWADIVIDELLKFPFDKHDDTVDALSQALNRMRGTAAAFPKQTRPGKTIGNVSRVAEQW